MSAATGSIDYLETLIGYILEGKPVRDLGEAIGAVRHQLEKAAAAEARGIAVGLERAAQWHDEQSEAATKQVEKYRKGGFSQSVLDWQLEGAFHRVSIKAIRALPHDPIKAEEGRGG